ncbi:MAG: InlB B-repeat-containing protein [Treponema sp.]|jgi:hypothetical protein|nr:InlB B-repeat-containing protein [Treponema sp.]
MKKNTVFVAVIPALLLVFGLALIDCDNSTNGGITYTVTFDAAGGSAADRQTVTVGDSLTFPSTTRSGYSLNGWYTASSEGTKAGDAGASFTPTAGMTLYAPSGRKFQLSPTP